MFQESNTFLKGSSVIPFLNSSRALRSSEDAAPAVNMVKKMKKKKIRSCIRISGFCEEETKRKKWVLVKLKKGLKMNF